MPFLSKLQVDTPSKDYPFSIPAIQALARGLVLHPKVTFLAGENGTGKSTLLEGLADKWGFSKESGNRSKNFGIRDYDTALAPAMTLTRNSARPMRLENRIRAAEPRGRPSRVGRLHRSEDTSVAVFAFNLTHF